MYPDGDEPKSERTETSDSAENPLASDALESPISHIDDQ